MRVINLTEAGGNWSVRLLRVLRVLRLTRFPQILRGDEFVGIFNLWKFVIICGRF